MNKKPLLMTVTIIFIAMISTAQQNGTFTDSRDGKTYKTIKIGKQTWMAENLAYKTNSGCWAYDNKVDNIITYGCLYDWETAKNVCPKGWHLPSYKEWTKLTDYLGGEIVAGAKLKETGTKHWSSPNTGATNETGFTAIPGGGRNIDGTFIGIGLYGGWWSDTEGFTYSAGTQSMYYYNSKVLGDAGNKGDGCSVRCLRD